MMDYYTYMSSTSSHDYTKVFLVSYMFNPLGLLDT